MTDTAIVLGDVALSGFEIPAQIPFGGDQALKVHKLLGGARVVDALGRDDIEIAWTGRFQGADAEGRAQLLDQMRQAGQPVSLTWGEQSYTVVIAKFTVDWQRFYQQPYSISCVIVTDNSSGPAAADATLDDLVDGDMTSVGALSPSITDPTVQPAINGLNAAIAAVGTLQGASLTALGPVATAAQSATSIIGVALTKLDGATLTNAGSVAGVVAGGFPAAMVTTFEAQAALISQQASLQEIDSLVRRVSTNIAQATG